ncbi:MAG: hypothetical protein AB7O37_23385 [Vicinamibacteria bacterium]
MKHFLALTAVLFLLLRPVCEVQAASVAHDEHGAQAHATASDHDHESVPCCAELDDGVLATPSAAAIAPGAGDGKLAFPSPVLNVLPAERRPGALARHPPDALTSPLSFYARTARIRR